jgi:ribosome-associated protein
VSPSDDLHEDELVDEDLLDELDETELAAPHAVPATPRSSRTTDDIRVLAAVAARAADDKQANDVLLLDVGETFSVTDAFVIASASNTRLVASIADEIEAAVKAAGGPGPIAVEGLEEANWVLLDFGGFVVHVFLEDTRRYYDLERLWSDAPRLDWRA